MAFDKMTVKEPARGQRAEEPHEATTAFEIVNARVKRVDDALRLLFQPGDVFELRALRCPTGEEKFTHRGYHGYYDFAHINRAAWDAISLTAPRDFKGLKGREAEGVYVTLNPIQPTSWDGRTNEFAVSKKNEATKDTEVLSRRWLFIDCDPVRPGKVSSSEDEKRHAEELAAKIKAELSAAKWPDPILADSGNGFHLLYRIDLPPNDDDLVRNCLRALAAKHDSATVTVDTSVFNPSRIVKLYGTVTRKGSHSDDRPHREATILHVPESVGVASIELLKLLAATAPAEAARTTHGVVGPLNDGPVDASIIKLARQHLLNMPDSIEGQGGSGALLDAAACIRIGFNLSFVDTLGLLREYNRTKCRPDWPESELERKIGEAEKKEERAPGYLLKGNRSGNDGDSRFKKGEFNSHELPPLGDDDDVPFSVPAGVSTVGEAGAIADDPIPADTEESVSPYKPIQPYPVLSVIHPEGQTELANSQRLVNQFGRNLRFVKKWSRWVVWDGMRWRLDCEKNTEAMKFAKSLAASLWTKKALSDEDAVKYCKKMASHAGCRSTLNLAASDLAIEHGDMDQNAWLLNVKNGTIDLRSGSLRQHERGDLLTKLCHSTFDPSATCPRFDQFLQETFPDPDLQSFIQRLFGYGLTADVSEHVLPIFWGAGSNGKSTLIEIIQSVVGAGYATSAADELLLAGKSSRHPTEVADLYGMRLVFASETDDGRRLNEGLVKRLTGDDEISARRMREDFWKFRPTHKLFLATNHKPQVRGTDQGIWRRLLLVPFVERFEGSRKIKNLAKKIVKEERSGILAWAVRGCLDWQTAGLNPPEAVLNSTAEYRREEDVISEFIHDCCLTGYLGYKVRFSQLYDSFLAWAAGDDEEKRHGLPTKKALGSWLKENGYQEIRSNGISYSGIGLKA